MWASQCQPWPSITITTTTPPHGHQSLTMLSLNSNQESKGSGPNSSLITASKSSDGPKKRNKQKPRQPKGQEEKMQLTGADVLWALQKASTEKAKKKKEKREAQLLPDTEDGDSQRKTEDIVASVRDLVIKPEWSDQLEELERQLKVITDF